MWDPHKEIQTLIDNFVADLSDVAKRIAIEQLKIAFGTGAKLAALPSPPPIAITAPSSRSSRARRGQREIEALRGKVLAAIADRPGRRAEDINSMLGTKTPQIAQLLRRLVADQLVRTEGARRGTRYFAVTGEVPNGRRQPSTPPPVSSQPSDAPVAVEEPAS